MSTPGEEQPTLDSETPDEKARIITGDAFIATGDMVIKELFAASRKSSAAEDYLRLLTRYMARDYQRSKGDDPDIQWPEEHVEVGDVFHNLSPESADRILNMVEREQDYERQAEKTEIWLQVAGLLLVIGLTGALISVLVFSGMKNGSSVQWWLSGLFGLIPAAVIVYVAHYSSKRTAARRFSETRLYNVHGKSDSSKRHADD